MNTRPWLAPLAIAMAAVAAFSLAPFSGLVWDDAAVVDYQLDSFRSIADVLRPPEGIVRWSYGYYRPLVIASYLADARVFGAGNAAGPHVTNLLLHVLASLLVWRLARRVLAGEAGALFAALVFAVHPIHAEAVSWIAGRSDVLATGFVLASVLAALRSRDGGGVPALIASPVLYLLALLSKETGVTALALAPLALALIPPAGGQRRFRASHVVGAVLFAAATALYLWLRLSTGYSELVLRDMGLAERAQRIAEALAYYVARAVVPWPQSAVVPWSAVPSPAATAAILLAAAALGAWSFRRWLARGDGAWLLAVAWFGATITVPLWAAMDQLSNTPLAERHLYLPSVGVALLAGLALSAAVVRRRAVALGVAAALVAVFLVASLVRGAAWRSDLALWTDATRGAHVDGLSWTNLGVAQAAAGEDDLALVSYGKAIADPLLDGKWVSRAHNGAGRILLSRGDEARAESEFRASIEAWPDYVEPYENLGMLNVARAERREKGHDVEGRDRAAEAAIGFLSTARRRFPYYEPARLELASFLLRYGGMLEAEGRTLPALRRYEAGLDALGGLGAGSRSRGAAKVAIDEAEVRRDLAEGVRRLKAG